MKTLFFILAATALPLGLHAQLLRGDSAIKMFCNKLNAYRNSLSLCNIYPEPAYKKFVDRHSVYQARMNDVTHGEGDFTFDKRYDAYPALYRLDCQENCTVVVMKNPNDLEYLTSQILLHFQHSKPHNKGLINPDFKKFYFGSFKKDEFVYVTLLLSE